MPTINEVMERAARVKPCAIGEEEKARWLMEMDGLPLCSSLNCVATPL